MVTCLVALEATFSVSEDLIEGVGVGQFLAGGFLEKLRAGRDS